MSAAMMPANSACEAACVPTWTAANAGPGQSGMPENAFIRPDFAATTPS